MRSIPLYLTLVLALGLCLAPARPARGADCVRDGIAAMEKSIRRKLEKDARHAAAGAARERKAAKAAALESRRSARAKAALARAKKSGPLTREEYRSLNDAEAYYRDRGMTTEADAISTRLKPEREKRARLTTERSKRRAKTVEYDTLPESLAISSRAKKELDALDADGNLAKRARAARNAIHQIAKDPRYPSLRTKKLSGSTYNGIDVSKGDIYQSYAENGVPGAYRIFWRYRDDGEIEILSVAHHPD